MTEQTHVRAPVETVYRLVAEVEFWPALFPQVRAARVLRRANRHRLVLVRSSWHGLPVTFRARQTEDVERCTVTFLCVGPLGRCATVVWSFEPAPEGGTTVTVAESERSGARPSIVLGPAPGAIFGAGLLARVKEIAEGGSLAGRA